MKKTLAVQAAMMLVILALAQTIAWAQTNEPPPAGAILDLNGTPIPGGGNDTF